MQAMLETKITTINGKRFVSNLWWEPLRERNYMREARAIGKREEMDIVAIRMGSKRQAGFVKKGNGVAKGMYSLAAALAGVLPYKAWIGAFALPDGQYALVAVYEGNIVPGCDWIGDRDDVLDALREQDSQPDTMRFEQVFHPADFSYHGSVKDIEQILVPQAMRKDYELRQLTFGLTRREWTKLGAGVGIVLAAGIGYQQWEAYKAREAAALAQRQAEARQKALEELNKRTGSEQQVQALQHPWASQPGIEDFLNGCQGAIQTLPLGLGGWTFTSAICTPATLEVVYGRTGKTPYSTFVQAAQGHFPNPPVLLEGGEQAGLGDEITLGAGGDDQLPSFEELQAAFTSYLQQLDLKAEIVPVPVVVPPPPPLPGGTPAPPAPVPDWKQFSFTLTTAHSPRDLFSGLTLKGVRLVEIKVDRQDVGTGQTRYPLTWTIKGALYAR